jgi:tRNA-dihydrouridine synthase
MYLDGGAQMILIHAENRALTFNGDSQSALALVNSIRDAYGHDEMPKLLNDFIFNIEAALQDAGVLDEWFSEVTL